LLIPVSILAPNDVKANMELYDRIDFRKYLDRISPPGFNNRVKNGGGSLRNGKLTLPPRQQRWNQNCAPQ
jgi:hypothetical protein